MRRLSEAADVISTEEALRILGPAVARCGSVLIAVSGGPDSVALLGLYAEAMAHGALPYAEVATVDHQLRPGSGAEAEAVAAMCARFGLLHTTLRWDGEKPRSGVQEAARDARYRLLTAHAEAIRAQGILVAHTLDDQAETVLMRMIRGSGLKGLGGMERLSLIHRLPVIRPLLAVPKARLIATCAARGWAFAVDPSNANPGFMRARLRHLAPALAREGLSAERLARFAGRMRRADEALDAEALRVMEACRIWERGAMLYDAEKLAASHEEIVVRVFSHVIAIGRDSADSRLLPRLERIEALTGDFRRAVREKLAFRRNAGGMLFTLRNGVLSLRAEPERKRKPNREKG